MGDLFEEHRTWAERIGSKCFQKMSATSRGSFLEDQLINAALMGLHYAVRRFNPSRGSFKAYAYKRVVGAIRDECREHSGRKMGVIRPEVQPNEETPQLAVIERPVEALISAEECKRLLDRIPARSRKLVTFHVIDGMSFHEIADKTGLSAWQVSRRVKMALRLAKKRQIVPVQPKVVEQERLEDLLFEKILGFYMRKNRGPTYREVVDFTGWTYSTVKNAVQRLRDKGRLKPPPKPSEMPIGTPVVRRRSAS